MSFVIEEGGLSTTIQDAGRYGWQRYGVSPCGFMDWRSAALANILVGNHPGEALLEATMMGPSLRITEDVVTAITGAEAEILLDGQPASSYARLFLKKGQNLSFNSFRKGARLYIAFQGGIQIPLVMRSGATDLRFGFGGQEGRRLKKGDEVFLKRNSKSLLKNKISVDEAQQRPESGSEYFSIRPEIFSSSIPLRVIMGPQEDVLTSRGWRTFLEEEFQLSPQWDRMGCRLLGNTIEQKGNGNILSEGITTGAIQLPEDGQMIALMADHQTVGGYSKIAYVISADLPKLAQGRPGDTVCFRPVSVQKAQQLYNQQQEELRQLMVWQAGGIQKEITKKQDNW